MTKVVLPLGVLLIALVVPLNHAAAGRSEPPQTPVFDDFRQFWTTRLGLADATPPGYNILARHKLFFCASDGRQRVAWCSFMPRPHAATVLHLTDEPAATPMPDAASSRGQVVFAWRESAPAGPPIAVSTEQHGLFRAILDACRLTQVLCGMEGVGHPRVAIVGEGYAAMVALAVAALMPTYVESLVAHQPICPVRVASASAAASAVSGSRELPPIFDRLRAANFARLVSAPTLVTVGSADRWADPQSVQEVFEALRGQKRLLRLEGVGHCPARHLPDWDRTWQAWPCSMIPDP